MNREDKFFSAWIIILSTLSLAWLGFMGWLLYTLAEWAVNK